MGGGASQLSPQQIQELKRKTPFDEKDITRILKRYAFYDPSEHGIVGIPYDTIMKIPELVGFHAAPLVVRLFINEDTGLMGPEQFLYLWAALSSKTTFNAKKKFAFQCLDPLGRQKLMCDEVFRWFKLLYRSSLSDDQIMELVMKVLHGSHVATSGQITYEEFCTLVPEEELNARFTVDLQTTG